jgi:hypothetical protein
MLMLQTPKVTAGDAGTLPIAVQKAESTWAGREETPSPAPLFLPRSGKDPVFQFRSDLLFQFIATAPAVASH